MKKVFNILILLLVVCFVCTLTVYAQKDINKNSKGYIDVNKDNICDNMQSGKCSKYVDSNKNGKCDNKEKRNGCTGCRKQCNCSK